MERDLQELKTFSVDFSEFFSDFDAEMDYLANKATLDGQVQELQFIEQELKKGTLFFKAAEFKYPTFQHINNELELIDNMGKITDNSDFAMPLVAFNTYQLQVYNYIERLRDFKQLTIIDEDQLCQHELPRYFKSVYIPHDKFLLVGGQEKNTPLSSAKTFLLDEKGKLASSADMLFARQYFATCADYAHEFVYVVSGYNHERGLINQVEKFSLKARKWVMVESINHARINAAACKCGDRYVYLFGGLDKKEFIDKIERFNMELDIWTILKVKMPEKMANMMAFAINNEYIMIMGGMKKKQEEFLPKDTKKLYELENRVFAFKASNFKWKDLKPFPFKKKFGNIVYNGFGKFFCFVIENNKQLPELFVYDVRNCFPQFDKYWENEKNQREGLQKIKGKDIKMHVAYSLSYNQEKQYGVRNYEGGPVNIADTHIDKQLFNYTGEPLPSS